MDGINLINDNTVEEPVILSTEQLERVDDFKKTLESEGVVCKKDVLSLEEFLGVNIVTKVINSKKFTNIPSKTKYVETLECVSEYSDKYEPVTNFMVLEQAKSLKYHLNDLVRKIVTISNPKNNDFLDKIISDEYGLKMEDNSFVNVADMDLNKVMQNEYHYLITISDETHVANLISLTSNIDELYTGLIVLTSDMDLNNFYYRPHLETINDVTIRDIVKIVKNGSVIPKLKDLMELLERDINALTNDKSWDTYDGRELATTFKRYKSLDNILCDKKSGAILSFLIQY